MRGKLPAQWGFNDKSEISKKYQQAIGYEWTQNESFVSRFAKKKPKPGGTPPPPMRKETFSRITYIGDWSFEGKKLHTIFRE